MFITNPDMVFAEKFENPRMNGQYPLTLAINAVLEETNGTKADITTLGKPFDETFKYAERSVRR